MFGGTLPAKTTAVAYSIRCSRRRENSCASAGLTSGPYSLISVCEPLVGAPGAGDAHGPRAPRQVLRAAGELLRLGRAHVRAVLVDLRLRAAHGVDDGRRGPGVPLYLHQVEGDGGPRQAVADCLP